MHIHWFPGHMTKSLRLIEENLKTVDAIVYVLDARAPLSCINESFDKLIEGKSILFVLNKIDLADKAKVAVWQKYFAVRPEPFTKEEKKAYLAKMTGVSLGSDAFFPFSDNIDRAAKSGVSFVAQPGGSLRDDIVISAADSYNMAMVFTGMRLFHH